MNELNIIKEAARKITETQKKSGYVRTGFYVYTDDLGNILYARLRMDKADGTKWIRPLSRDDAGNWTQLKEPTFTDGKPLYNLQAIAKEPDKPVFIVEGEKCANALIKLGLIATTSGGATSAKDANWQILAGREVWIWADNDDAGRQYASDVKAKLTALNCTVYIIDISALNLPAKGDCVDWLEWFDRFHGRNATKADVQSLSIVKNEAQDELIQNNHATALDENYPVTVNLQCAADITPEPIHWLWDGWLAKGKLHIFAGAAGTGKTTLAISIAATVTQGGAFADGYRCQKGSVLIWSGEDSPADTLVPRLMAAEADLTKVHFVGDATENHELRAFDPATDMQPLMLKAASIPDLALLIIDPIVNAVAGDSHKNGEVRRALQPVVDFGEKLNCAVLGITHFSKGGQGKDPLERVTGSLAFGALARIVLATAKIDDGENTTRIVCRAKSNISPDTGGFEYDLQEKEVQAGIFSSYALWGKSIEGSARELLAEPEINGDSADCSQFISELLALGRQPSKDVTSDCLRAGYTDGQIRRAREKLKIKPHREGFGKGSVVYWDLPIASSYMSKTTIDAIDAEQNSVTSITSMVEKGDNSDDVMEF